MVAKLNAVHLLDACRSNAVDEVFKCVHEQGIDVNCHDDDGITPLQLAAASGNDELVSESFSG